MTLLNSIMRFAAPAVAAESQPSPDPSDEPDPSAQLKDEGSRLEIFEIKGGSDKKRAEAYLFGVPLHGTIKPSFRMRSAPDAEDKDFYTLLHGDVGESRRNHISASAMGRIGVDVSNHSSEEDEYQLRDPDDSFGRVHGRLYQGYVDGNRLGPVDRVRLGRQFNEETPEWLHFDGGSIRSAEWKKAGRLSLEGYGGLPVHFYQGERKGDVVAGAALNARPWQGGRLRADYLYLRDDNFAPGTDDHIYGGGIWQRLGSALTLHARANGMDDKARDVRGDISLFYDPWGLSAQLGYFELLNARTSTALSADHLEGVLFEEKKFRQVSGFTEKTVGEYLFVGAGTDLRFLVDPDDTGIFNHEFQRYWLGPTLHDWPVKALELSLTGELWDAPDEMGGTMMTAGGEIAYRLKPFAHFRLGSNYARYRYDFLLNEELEDSQIYYGQVDGWYKPWGLHGQVRYELEDASIGKYHTLWTTLGVGF